MIAAAPRSAELPTLHMVRTPKIIRRLAWTLLTVLMTSIPALAIAPWTQTVHGVGRAIAFDPAKRPQYIISPIEGRVKKWHVMEGDVVKKGDLLVELVDNDPQILERLREQETLALQRLALADGRVNNQRSRLQFVKDEREVLMAEASLRVEQAEAQVLVVMQELERARFDLRREELAFERLSRLHNSPVGQVVSKDDVEEAERKRDLAKAQVPLVEARIRLAEKSLDAAKAQREATDKRLSGLIESEESALKGAQSEQAAVQQQYNTIKTQVQRQENQRVTASVEGTVFRVLANAEAGGQLVRPGERLAVLVPEVSRESIASREGGVPGIVAELVIAGNDLPLVRVGDRVLLQFEGWAAVQFASVPDAAVGTFEGRVFLVDTTTEGDGGDFRILVEPAPGADWPDPTFLRQGVRAQGWVVLKQVTMGYELWRLMNGFPPARELHSKEFGHTLGPVDGKDRAIK